ncbi:MAG TPA: hypothetical protein VNO22_13925 [Planctomycetota bacterium]|nr:hypothetical protein [Planctomycetota bacterium]
MQKWSYFSMGIMSGIIAVLLTVVVLQNREPRAEASPLQTADSAAGAGLLIGTGASQSNMNDILWVIYKRPAETGPSDLKKSERLTLCCYQVSNGARTIKLAAVRDITYDMDLLELSNDRPHVRDIVEDLRKQKRASGGGGDSKDNK